MREVMSFISSNSAYFLIGTVVLSLVLLVYCGSLSRRLARFTKRREAKLADGRLEDILDYLQELSGTLSNLSSRLDKFSEQQALQNTALSTCLQKTGMVRFNAFDDVGGEQSFAMALLDANRDGIVISSLYGRQDSRLYAKGIVRGEGERPLSNEERLAVERALS